jgi:hypothetical protein
MGIAALPTYLTKTALLVRIPPERCDSAAGEVR